MVPAVSNALGLPVIVFSSAHHHPLIYTTPRVCNASIPLYVAFNQANAGHYDAVTFRDASSSTMHTSYCSPEETAHDKCTCGQKGKHYTTSK